MISTCRVGSADRVRPRTARLHSSDGSVPRTRLPGRAPAGSRPEEALVRAWDRSATSCSPQRREAADAENLEALNRRASSSTRRRPEATATGPSSTRATTSTHTRTRAGRPARGGHRRRRLRGAALGVALERAGWPVGAVASRDPARRERFRSLVSGVRAFAEPEALIDDVELVRLAVPDDVVVPLAGSLRLYARAGDRAPSGLLGRCSPRRSSGEPPGRGVHPLVAFADLDRALAACRARPSLIEGDDGVAGHLGGYGRGDSARSPSCTRLAQGRLPRGRGALFSSRCSTSSWRWARRDGHGRGRGAGGSTCRWCARTSKTLESAGAWRAR